MVERGGSQCGYCTPGFVVSLFCEYYRPGRRGYDPEAISGNLCRCTGYRPIADVARSMQAPAPEDAWPDTLAHWLELAAREASAHEIPALAAAQARTDEALAVRPSSLEQALHALATIRGAAPFAGGTDLMVYANQRGERWPALVAIDTVPELRAFASTPDEFTLGAALALSDLADKLERSDGGVPLLAQLWPLFSSRLIRHRATLGGNLATASPIGDAAPALLALDAEVTLASAGGVRRVPLAGFFTGYRTTALRAGELIVSVHVPRPLAAHQRFYKVSKRVLDDISTVSAAFALTLDGEGRVARLRAAYGGIAATPLRALEIEHLAAGAPWTAATIERLGGALASFGTPLSDHRGSAAYRAAMVRRCLERFFAEIQAERGSV
jgi:xanthine dehydrogenase small subunit